jgi:hypothetical protein
MAVVSPSSSCSVCVLRQPRPPIHCFVQPFGRQPFQKSSSRAAGTHLANNRSDRHLDRMCEDFGVKRAAVGMPTSRTVTIFDVDRWFARADSISGGFSRYPPGGQTDIMSARCPELGIIAHGALTGGIPFDSGKPCDRHFPASYLVTQTKTAYQTTSVPARHPW